MDRPLTARQIGNLKTPGRYRVGGVAGLCIQISDSGSRSWLLRYEIAGRERWMGLGSSATFSVAEVRERARKARQLLADGIDPIEDRKAAKAAAALATAKSMTFQMAADRL